MGKQAEVAVAAPKGNTCSKPRRYKDRKKAENFLWNRPTGNWFVQDVGILQTQAQLSATD